MSGYKILKDIGLIVLSQFLTSIGAFLLLPIITKTLGSYDYGIWTQILATVSLLSSISLLGLSMGIVRFLSGEKDKNKIREMYFSVVFIVIFSGLLVSNILYLSSDFLAINAFNDIKASYFIKYSSLLVLFISLEYIELFYFRIFNQIKTFSKLTIFKSIAHLIISIFLLNLGFGLLSIIISYLFIEIILFVFSFHLIISQIGFSVPKFEGIGEILRYSIPLAPNSLIKWITDYSDKYLVTYFLGLSASGIYSAAYSIGNLMTFILYPIQFVLFPELSKLYNNGEYEKATNYVGLSLKYFLFLAIPAAFGLSFLSKPILGLLTTSEFVSGSNVIPLVAFAILMAGVLQILINILQLVKKTKSNLYIFSFGAISNIVLNIIFIPLYGIIGAAFATLISYICMVLICAKISFKYMRPKIDWIFIVKSIISSCIMLFVISNFSINSFFNLIIHIVVGAVMYILSIILLDSFSKEEKKLLLNLLYKITSKKIIEKKIIKINIIYLNYILL